MRSCLGLPLMLSPEGFKHLKPLRHNTVCKVLNIMSLSKQVVCQLTQNLVCMS